MKLQNTLLLTVLLFCYHTVFSQKAWFSPDSLPLVRHGDKILINPWTGGLNALQYSTMDLNEDGVEDLVVFDRTTSKVSTFIADHDEKNFKYHSEYEDRFPPVANWMLLVDYDGDGKKELFTHVTQGVTVYKQVQDPLQNWKWENFKQHLTTRGLSGNNTNLQVVASDIPALVDFDGDGDLDIISFESNGDFVELNQNMSMERYGIPDSLEFVRNGACWGDFRKHTCDDFVFGIDCGVITEIARTARMKHAGNALLLHDFNGDGKKDMLIGNVECENLSIVYNDASGLAARFTSYQPTFPQEDPVAMHIFPAAYMEDVDFDGVKDLLVSPNVYGNDDLMIDFIHSSWYYHNAGSNEIPDFQLRQNDFLQAEMIDVGENAALSFFDVDGDGAMDMVIGNRGQYQNDEFKGSLWLYRNSGTLENPEFSLESSDYLELSSLGFTDLQPQWLDFNGDGKTDLGIAAIKDRRLHFFYFPNSGAVGGAPVFNSSELKEVNLPTELTVSDRVHFYDYDRDGDMDLIVGGVLGNISLYENAGSPSHPIFQLRDSALGGMGPSFSGRYRSVAIGDLDLDGRADVVMVDQSGKVNILYEGDWGNWTKRDTAVILSRETGEPISPYLGNRLHISVADINGDKKPDIAVGTLAGGAYLFRNILPVSITGREPSPKFYLYPNPTQEFFNLYSEESGAFTIYDLNGSPILNGSLSGGTPHPVYVRGWKKGIYLIRLNTHQGFQVQKLVVH